MKKNYQKPLIEITSIEPFHVIADTVINFEGKSSDGTTILNYGGGGNGPARSGESNLWDDEDDGSNWDSL
jgi:hypothetical protein